jgi:hypothetical protein
MKLVDNARRAWRWFSMHCMAGAAAIQAAWIQLPDDLRSTLTKPAAYLTIALMVLGVIGRLVKQDEPDK